MRRARSGGLHRVAKQATDHPVAWMIATLLSVGICAAGIPRLQIRTDGSAVHPRGSPVIARSEDDRKAFADPLEVIVLITPSEPGQTLESPEGLEFLRDAHRSLEELDGLHPLGVLSLGTIPDGLPERLSDGFPTLLDTIPRDPALFQAQLRKFDAEPIARGLFLAPGGSAGALYIHFRPELSPRKIIETVHAWIEERASAPYDLHLLGPLVAETTLGEKVLEDLTRLVPLMVVLIGVLLLIFLRSVAGFVVPMAVSLLVLLSIFGVMGHVGAPITLVTTILPVILMVMGITDEVHLLERVGAHLEREGPADRVPSRETVARAVLGSLAEIGRPIVLTSLTTAIAFLSFLTASIAPVRDLGLYASAGILLAMLLTFSFSPAVIVLLPASWVMRRSHPASGPGSPPPFWERRAIEAKGTATLPAILLLMIGLPGVLSVRVGDAWIDNFDPSSPLARADRVFNERLWGTYRYDVVLEGERGFFSRAQGARLAEEFTRLAESGPHVSGVLGYLDALEAVADDYGEALPLSGLPDLIVRRLAFGAATALGHPFMNLLVNVSASSARFRIFVSDADYARGRGLQEYLEERLPGLVQGSGVRFHFSGDLPTAVEVVRAVVADHLGSIAWTFAGIALLLTAALRSVRVALSLLIPVVSANWVLFAALGYLGKPLGIATSLFAALTMGVGVDYALHLHHGFERSIVRDPDPTAALRRCMEGVGRAVRWNAFTLGLAFLALAFSAIPPNRALGALLCAAMLACYGATLLFVPRFLRRADPIRPAQSRPIRLCSPGGDEPVAGASGREEP